MKSDWIKENWFKVTQVLLVAWFLIILTSTLALLTSGDLTINICHKEPKGVMGLPSLSVSDCR